MSGKRSAWNGNQQSSLTESFITRTVIHEK
ncbi:hypothetical protein HNR53_000830 [Bacillus benzoevorans]|uniref:Uncharacterized protein n=1 Tax=Bacillus benzoevorans TaxID=1456 RepID=A0A7X0LV53_9BACI|nr:hypothetical protein [Bacillus benzoevorans]